MVSLQHLVSQSVASYPEKPCIFTSYDTWSFRELDRMSDQIASRLVPFYQKDVVILLKPSSVYYACLLACLKAGAIAVPIDISLPAAHIDSLLSRIHPIICIGSKGLMSQVKQSTLVMAMEILFVDSMHGDLDPVKRPTDPGELVHRVFTSGSSGHATLVAFNHETLLHDAIHTSAYYGFVHDRNIVNMGRYTSSLGINGFWRALTSGAGFVTFDLRNVTFLQVWETIQSNNIQVIQGQPTLIGKLIDALKGHSPSGHVRHFIIGGEPITNQLISDIMIMFPLVDKISYNYSSTETMLISAYTDSPDHLSEMGKIPVGVPAKDKIVEIIREDGSLAEQGEPGQVVVRSKYLAAILDGKDADKRLIVVGGSSGVKCYYTGDMGRFNEQGLLEHYGRVGRQIKIQGIRIDPEYIENKLLRIPGVKKCHVLAVLFSRGKQKLVAAIITDRDITDQQMIDALSPVLPLSHIPDHFIRLHDIPQNRSGKTDAMAIRKVVEAKINHKKATEDHTGGEIGQLKKFLVAEWSRILGEQVSDVEHPIFHLGADSISIFEMTLRVNEAYSIDLNPSWVLKHSSINQQENFLLSVIEKRSDDDALFTPERVRELLGWNKKV